jgi:hypothetical protein
MYAKCLVPAGCRRPVYADSALHGHCRSAILRRSADSRLDREKTESGEFNRSLPELELLVRHLRPTLDIELEDGSCPRKVHGKRQKFCIVKSRVFVSPVEQTIQRSHTFIPCAVNTGHLG